MQWLMSSYAAARRIVVLNAGTATLKIATFEIRSGGLVETQRAEYAWLDQADGSRLVRELARLLR
jgi:hypothetical protein